MTDFDSPRTTPQPEKTIAGLTKAQFDVLNGQNGGRLKAFSLDVGPRVISVVVRPPTLAEYDRHTSELMDLRTKKERALNATLKLLRNCILAPALEQFNADLELYPAIGDKFGEKALEMTGAEAEVREESFL
jgi:hypothetical protein